MKKKRLALVVACIMVILVTAAVFLLKSGIRADMGIYIAADHGSELVVLDGRPVVIHPRFGKECGYSDLHTGDLVFLIHDGIDASYPGETASYWIWKWSDGDESHVPKEILTELQELGWWNGPS